jgi:hypothetical protein
VLLLDATSLAPGDDVEVGAVISADFVEEHGMTGVWGPFNDTWAAFARRTVVSVNTAASPHRVLLDVPLRSALLARDGASVRRESGGVRGVGIEHLGLSSAVGDDAAHAHDQVVVLSLENVSDAWVRDVASFASPVGDDGAHLRSGGIRVNASKRVTIEDVVLERAQHRGEGGNGYLLELRTSNEVLVKNVVARAGRHNFIQNWGFGTSGCVFTGIHSSESATVSDSFGVALPSGSEFHHSLATANLIEDAVLDDGWAAGNRGDESSGAGHSATENVFWNVRGAGRLRTFQFGWGYVVGTDAALRVMTEPDLFSVGVSDAGTAPVDHVEGEGLASTLAPQSLYHAQRALRLPPE